MSTAPGLDALIQSLKYKRLIVDYFEVAPYAVLIYDYLLMFDLEVELIWRRRWSYTKLLFILTRYIPIIGLYFVLHNQMFLDATPEKCRWTFAAAAWLVVAGIVSAEAVLAIRTWAVSCRSTSVGVLLLILQLANFFITWVYTSKFLKSLVLQPEPYPGYRGCFVIDSGHTEWVSFLTLTIVEAVVLTMMCRMAFEAYRMRYTNAFLNVIHRDAIAFYFYLMIVLVANTVGALTLPNMFTPLQSVLHSVFTTRIIINIRIAGEREIDMIADLHTNGLEGLHTNTLSLASHASGPHFEDSSTGIVPPPRDA